MASMYESGLILKQDTHGRIFVPVQRLIELAQEFERSGLSAPKFAAMAGVKYQTFVTWRRKHGKPAPVRLCLPIESGLLSTRSNCDFLAKTAVVLNNIHSARSHEVAGAIPVLQCVAIVAARLDSIPNHSRAVSSVVSSR